MTDNAAPDVLVLRPAVINLYDRGAAGHGKSRTRQTFFDIGRADDVVPGTLRFGDEPAARARDRPGSRRATTACSRGRSRAGNITAADEVMTKWSDTLRHYMEAARGAQ